MQAHMRMSVFISEKVRLRSSRPVPDRLPKQVTIEENEAVVYWLACLDML